MGLGEGVAASVKMPEKINHIIFETVIRKKILISDNPW
jgi:hypothetical protein